METPLETAGLLMVALALVKVIETLVTKRWPKLGNNSGGTATYSKCIGLDPTTKTQIKTLVDMHQERYPDGMLKWHTPPELMTTLAKISEQLKSVSQVSKDTVRLLHEIETREYQKQIRREVEQQVRAEQRRASA